MVLPTILYGLEPQEQETLFRQLRAVSEKTETPFRILMTTNSLDDAAESIRTAQSVTLLVIAVDNAQNDKNRMGVRLGYYAKQVSRDHYVVYLIRDRSELEVLLPICSRASGILIAPPGDKASAQVFTPLFEDYHKIYSRDGSEDGKWINLKSNGKLYRVHAEDICMVQTVDKMVEYHAGKQVISVYDTMDNVESLLGEGFIRCHRSYLINQEHIQYIDFREMCILLTNGDSIPLARSFKESMQRKFPAAGKT
ncbi:MAG: LytTR family transcriptional regulator DNA-binding domain-containing protein [Clostridia bacterium]|nr:LytTR family transcriptional regulator DNA-binding domain-containing protein [Clostridia bacterium]